MSDIKPPITRDAVSDQWIADVRQARDLSRGELRACPIAPRIEARKPGGPWATLMLPGSGYAFVDAAERDAVLSKLLT
jgi:hypothetical protein